MKTEIRTDLLRKLSDHLINGQLGHEKFDYGKFNDLDLTVLEQKEVLKKYISTTQFLTERNYCGTNGCAIGECPIVFPEYWVFTDIDDFISPVLRSEYAKGNCSENESARIFFNIVDKEFCHLFIPSSQDVIKYGGKNLTLSASKEEVAQNIIHFCDLADQGKL